jgi:hypothetical protein
MKVEIHFSLIAAAVTYVMWKNVGKAKAKRDLGMKALISDDDTLDARKRGHFRVNIFYLFQSKSRHHSD